MKWLILLALIASCGKHEEPRPLDIRDSDGDQVLNYQESDLDKYVANYESIGAVKASISFRVNDLITLELTNVEDLDSKISGVMVSNEKRLLQEEHFSEWAKLKVKNPITLPALKNPTYEVVIQFEKGSAEVGYVYFDSPKHSRLVKQWQQTLNDTLTAQDLNDLVTGKAHFVLRKNAGKSVWFQEDSAETIKQRTYRLLVDDGKSASVYYVSKELDFEGIQKLLGINAKKIVNEDDFFFNDGDLGATSWFGREFSNGDKVLRLTDFNSLRKRFLANYATQKVIVSRENGVPMKRMILTNKKDQNVYFKVKSLQKTQRKFTETRYKRTYGGHEEVKYTCTHLIREATLEKNESPDIQLLLGEIPALQNSRVQTSIELDKWSMKLNETPENFSFGFSPTAATNKVTVGLLSGPCGENYNSMYQVDKEYILSYEIESFVEKIP